MSESVIRVFTSDSVGRVNRNIYGHFTEHLGSCVYGGIWAEKHFPGLVVDGMRADVLELIRALKPPVDRWPGGCFSEYYHWEDGIGPLRDRPVTYDWFWQKPEPNSVGTHEFVEFCRTVGCEPVIAANVRTGTPEEAAAWVSYCNDPVDTAAGKRRAGNGVEAPFDVKLWDIGNEGWDMTAARYGAKAREFAWAMRGADPGIRLVAVGSCAGDMSWNETVLKECGDSVDFIAPHHYTGRGDRNESDDASFYNNVACSHVIEDTLVKTVEVVDALMAHRPEFGVAMDEWGVWAQHNQGLQHNYDASDGLIAAGVLNAMQRLSRRVTMANWAQLVNCLGMIQADSQMAFATPVYHVFWLYSNLCYPVALRTEVECEAFGVDERVGVGRERPVVDAMATMSDSTDSVTVTIANRGLHETGLCRLDLGGFKPSRAQVWALEPPGPFALNTPGQPELCRIVQRELADPSVLELPPHSVVAVRLSRQ